MRKQWPVLLLLLLVTGLMYWAGLGGPTLLDDNQNLEPLNQWLQGRLGWTSAVFGNRSGFFGRWVSMGSFVLNIELLGPGIWGLKLGNLLIHLLNGVIVFALFRALLRARAMLDDSTNAMRWLPLLGAAAWMLHPLLVSTVLYVVQRMAMLSATFMLLAMLSYVHGRMELDAKRTRRAAWMLGAVVPLCTMLAVFSKENGVLAPALCAVIELFVFRPEAGRHRPLASRIFIFCGLVLPALVAVALVAVHPHVIMDGYANRSFTLIERLLTQFRVLWSYVASILLPYGPRMGFYHDDYPISRDLLHPITTLISLLGWIVAVALAWRLRKRIPGVALGLAIFLVGQSLESSIFPLLNYFEHRNYLPSIGIVWALLSLVAFAGQRVGAQMDNGPRIAGFAGVSLVLALAMATGARASIWQSKPSLMAQALKYHPTSRWLRMDLAADAMLQSPPSIDVARAQLSTMLDSPDDGTRRIAAIALLVVDCSTGRAANAASLKAAFEGSPEPLEADTLLAFERLADGIKTKPCIGLSPESMAAQLSAMLDRSSLPASQQGIWRLRLKVAYLYLAAGNVDAALRQALMSYAGGTSDPQVAVFAADLMIRQANYAGAQRMLDSASRRINADDLAGKQIIAAYRSEIARRTKAAIALTLQPR